MTIFANDCRLYIVRAPIFIKGNPKNPNEITLIAKI